MSLCGFVCRPNPSTWRCRTAKSSPRQLLRLPRHWPRSARKPRRQANRKARLPRLRPTRRTIIKRSRHRNRRRRRNSARTGTSKGPTSCFISRNAEQTTVRPDSPPNPASHGRCFRVRSYCRARKRIRRNYSNRRRGGLRFCPLPRRRHLSQSRRPLRWHRRYRRPPRLFARRTIRPRGARPVPRCGPCRRGRRRLARSRRCAL